MRPNEIKRLRERLGWTQFVMAQHLHVSPMTVSRWERGERFPDEYNQVVLRQLRGRLDQAEREQRQQEFINKLKAVAIGGGIGLLLGKLFEGGAVEEVEEENTNEGSDTNDTESS